MRENYEAPNRASRDLCLARWRPVLWALCISEIEVVQQVKEAGVAGKRTYESQSH